MEKTYFKRTQKHKNNKAVCLIPARLKVWCLCQHFFHVPEKAAITTSEPVTQEGRKSYSFLPFPQTVYPLLHNQKYFIIIIYFRKYLEIISEDCLEKCFQYWILIGCLYCNWMVRKLIPSDRTLQLHFFGALRAAQLANALFPSSPEVKHHQADSCTWFDTLLSTQPENSSSMQLWYPC